MVYISKALSKVPDLFDTSFKTNTFNQLNLRSFIA
ncbi:hypothetical protein VME0621_01965 [Vibrio mediterranei]|nr:hypothetical protein VME0621_01965 [Vibrio mediterranei]